MAVFLRLYDKTKQPVALLPDHSNLQVIEEFNGPGALTFNYLRSGRNVNALLAADQGYIEIIENGSARPGWFILDEDGDDPANEAGDARPIQVSARGVMAMLEWALVYPEGHTAGSGVNGRNLYRKFDKQTPGKILRTLINNAKARGALDDLSFTFTDTVDSNGTAWPTQYTVQYDAQLDLLQVLGGMADNGWAEFRTNDFVLQAYVKDTVMGVTRDNVILRLGQNVLDGPRRRRTRRPIRSVVLGVGSEKIATESTDAGALATYGRREGAFADGRITNTGTLQALTETQLDTVKDASEGFTVRIAMDRPTQGTGTAEAWPMPGVDFFIADRVFYDQHRVNGTTLVPLRIRSIAWGWDDSTSARTCSLELNDPFVEQALRLKRRIDGIINGGSSDGAPPGSYTDPTPPKTPDELYADLVDLLDGQGNSVAKASLTWPPVTQDAFNEDYTARHSHYLVSYKPTSGPLLAQKWAPEQRVDGTSTVIENLTTGTTYAYRVRAVATNGVMSDYFTTGSIATPLDTTAPPPPSTPTLSPALGGIMVAWDGDDSGGDPILMDAPDFSRVDVHMGTSSGFTPTTATLVGYLGSAGQVYIPTPDYTTLRWFCLVSYDRSGNESGTPSGYVSGLPARVDDGDVTSGTLDFSKFTFSDAGNMVGDGSFESAVTRAAMTLPVGWLWGSGAGAQHGNWVLRRSGAPLSGSTSSVLVGTVAVTGSGPLKLRARVRAFGGSPTTELAGLVWGFYNSAGTLIGSTTTVQWTGGDTGGFWATLQSATEVTPPATARQLKVWCEVANYTTSTIIDFDSIEVRPLVETFWVRDAAIENAKIANGAITTLKVGNAEITSAKITNITAGQIVTGTMTATVTLSGTIRTAASGARVQIDGSGIEAFNSAGTKTVDINSSDGSVILVGSMSTGTTGARVEMSSGAAQKVKFYSGEAAEIIPGEVSSDTTLYGVGQASSRLTLKPPRTNADATNHPLIDMTSRSAGGAYLSSVIVDADKFISYAPANEVQGTLAVAPTGGATFPFDVDAGGVGNWAVRLRQGGTDYLWLGNIDTHTSMASVQAKSRHLNLGTWNGSSHAAHGVYSFTIRDMAAAGGVPVCIDSNGLLRKTDWFVESGTAAHVNASGILRKSSSSLRYKTAIEDLDLGSDWLDQLRPVRFKENGPVNDVGLENAPYRYGFIAEEVAEVDGMAPVVIEWDGQVESVMYDRMVPLLVSVVRDLRDRVKQLEGS